MKKSLLALAVLGAYAGVASAQSSVTIFGIIDLSLNQIENGNTKTTVMGSNQLNSNRLGFRGFEDLGGGLGAGFWIEAGMNNGTGEAGGGSGNTNNFDPCPPGTTTAACTGNTTGAAVSNGRNTDRQLFNRKSTVSLYSQRGGEIRLGRDYTPTFSNLGAFDAFGANGLANSTNLAALSNPNTGLGTVSTGVRANNSIAYHLPGNLGGFYGTAMYALGQGNDNNKYWGLRGGFATGPFDVALAYGETETYSPDKWKVLNFGGSWNFGFMKLYGLYHEGKFGGAKSTMWEISAGVPLGQGEFKAMYGDVNGKGTVTTAGFGTVNLDTNDATLWGLQYIYNLSKRTALYGGYAQLDNDPGSARTVMGGSAGSAAADKSTGFNVGVRHSF
jgi:predicted porin